MNFSRRQQQVLLALYVLYGIGLLWYNSAQRSHTLTSYRLEFPDPQEQLMYIDPPIDINAADTRELQFLPGIGTVLAQRIVDYRQQHGKFQNAESLMPIKHIGPKTIQKLQYYLIFPE
ncbi:putative comE operon protein 1 [Candidatus Vecturithrix granuli]|uniref:Putative comE operon protein 1 n=1 Tax=Vecturithrix granuli TaxID=1499967 RepID=A0A081BX59_VECG1|nr:putative comE operon protein 1 [Candidatus Vecturithrix granuli]